MAQVSARITLRDDGPLTFSGRRNFTRGQSHITSDATDILYFSKQAGFAVEMIKGKLRDIQPGATPSEDEDDAPAAAPSTPEKDEPVETKYTAEELGKQTKASLLELASADFPEVKVDASMSKAQIISAILAAGDSDESDDEDSES